MTERKIAAVVRKRKLGEVDEHAERRAYWLTQSIAARIAEVEALRRMWIERTGDPDQPMERVVHIRRLGEPAIQRPSK
jgi:hypothetical protein